MGQTVSHFQPRKLSEFERALIVAAIAAQKCFFIAGSSVADYQLQPGRQTLINSKENLPSPRLGGPGAAGAVVALKAGVPNVQLLTGVGMGIHGEALSGLLAERNIQYIDASRGEEEGSYTLITEVGGIKTFAHNPGANTYISGDTIIGALKNKDQNQILVTGLGNMSKITEQVLNTVVKAAHQVGGQIALSTQDNDDIPLVGALSAQPDLVIASESDLRGIKGCPRNPAQAAAWLLNEGAEKVAITKGEYGSIVGMKTWTGVKLTSVPAHNVFAIGTTGCGDTFQAIFARLVMVIRPESPDAFAMLAYVASAFSARVAERGQGADGAPTLNEALELVG